VLATPYAHLDDLAMLGLAAWLVLRTSIPVWGAAYILAGVIAIEGEPVWGPYPVIAAQLGALALVSAAALRPAPARPEPALAATRSTQPTTLR
jgi:hypothetical protein